VGLEIGPNGKPILTGASCFPPLEPRAPTPQRRATGGGKNEPKRKTADRFAVLNAFVDSTMSELSRSEIAVWFVLYRDTRNGTVKTSQANIARRAGTSVRGVKDALKNLTAAGLLRVVFQGGLNRGPSRYQVKALGKRTS
jgi:hypothetical protein